MADVIRDIIDEKNARDAAEEMTRTFHRIAERIGKGSTLAAMAKAVGDFCDGVSEETCLYMAAEIAKSDPERVRKMLRKPATVQLS